jgi:hypothetical protein
VTFSYNPGPKWDVPDGPPRLIRYVSPGTLPDDTICVFDAANNLLTVDRELLLKLNELDRAIVLKTRRPFIEIEYQRHRLCRLAA